MEANELRIGNYVNKYYCVQELDLISCGVIDMNDIEDLASYISLDLKNVKPIPLTEEWLVKFGFEKLEGWDNMYYFQIGNFQVYEYNVSGYDYDGFNIKHVHQLQNLYFALTNKELAIK